MKTERLQAVTTTGIYCRASCSARPSPQNVHSIPSPVAAEAAGYRSCLRCRSDRVEIPIETPSSEVNRAMNMIADGFLDEHTELDLARAVGYSARQLRRLFEKHVGATPAFVARSRRAHFARRLLDESTLTVTQIAYASGFNSLRQMNRVVKEIFSFTPSELRERRRRNKATAIDGGLTVTIPGTDAATDIVDYLAARAIPGVESVADMTYRRTIQSCGHPGVLEVTPHNDELQITAHLPSYRSLVDDVAGVRRLFATGLSPAAYKHLRADDLFGDIARRRPSLAMPGAWDRFETSIRIIIGQQISVAGATTITGRLVERLGAPLAAAVPHGLGYNFPGPDLVAEGDLAGLGITHARERTLRSFAEAVGDGRLPLHGGSGLEELTEQLERLPGIGPWTSQLMAARVFGHLDAFPAGDLGLRKAAGRLTGSTQPLSTKETEQLAERWRPYRAVAAAHLWFSGGE